jgi:hypothetical protein
MHASHVTQLPTLMQPAAAGAGAASNLHPVTIRLMPTTMQRAPPITLLTAAAADSTAAAMSGAGYSATLQVALSGACHRLVRCRISRPSNSPAQQQ